MARSGSLDHLFDRNVTWADGKTRNDPSFFRRMAEQQTPRYLWIGCSDSRVTANDVLGLDPGEVFVHRNIANVVHTGDLNMLTVLEYAVHVLEVEHVIVCGHYGCGGIARVIEGGRGALVDHWLQPITMIHRKHRAVFDEAGDPAASAARLCELNVEMQVRRVAATPIVETAWAAGRALHLHGWIYSIADGLLRELVPPVSDLAARDSLPTIDERARNPVEPLSGLRRQAIQAFFAADEGVSATPSCCPERPMGRLAAE